MNFAHHVPAEQTFANHTVINWVVMLGVVTIVMGIALVLSRKLSSEENKNEEE